MSGLSKVVKTMLWLLFAAAAVIGMVLVGWWLLRLLRDEEEHEEAVRIPSQRPADINIPLPPQPIDYLLDEAEAIVDEVVEAPPVVESEPAAAPAADASDDLTAIDGIGPKYAKGLNELGITTFARLQQADPDDLAEQLKSLGLRIIGDRIRSEDWIGQAAKLSAES
jgi:predicted flap endonuclease-1-like 5' DNA nuclease